MDSDIEDFRPSRRRFAEPHAEDDLCSQRSCLEREDE